MPEAYGEVAVATLMFIVVGYSVMAWLWIASRWWHGAAIIRFEPRRTAPWGAADVVVLLFSWLVMQIVLLVICRIGSGLPPLPVSAKVSDADRQAAVVAAVLNDLLGIVLAIGWLRFVRRATWSDLGWSAIRVPGDLRRGVVALASIIAPVYGLQYVMVQFFDYDHAAIDLLKSSHEPWTLAITVLLAAVAAPICEEIMFRLVLQGGLESAEVRLLDAQFGLAAPGDTADSPDSVLQSDFKGDPESSELAGVDGVPGVPAASAVYPPKRPDPAAWLANVPGGPRVMGLPAGSWPILISSALFALAHASQGLPPVLPLFILALVMGYLYRQTHRLLPSIVVHVLFNSCSLALLFLGAGK